MIETTLNYIIKAKNALSKIAQKDLPVSQSYNIAKIIRQADSQLLPFEDARIKLCEKYGTFDKSQNQYVINRASSDEFQRDMNELLEQCVNIDADPIKLADDITLSAKDIIDLEAFLCSEE